MAKKKRKKRKDIPLLPQHLPPERTCWTPCRWIERDGVKIKCRRCRRKYPHPDQPHCYIPCKVQSPFDDLMHSRHGPGHILMWLLGSIGLHSEAWIAIRNRWYDVVVRWWDTKIRRQEFRGIPEEKCGCWGRSNYLNNRWFRALDGIYWRSLRAIDAAKRFTYTMYGGVAGTGDDDKGPDDAEEEVRIQDPFQEDQPQNAAASVL